MCSMSAHQQPYALLGNCLGYQFSCVADRVLSDYTVKLLSQMLADAVCRLLLTIQVTAP